MQPLDKSLRNQLERTIREARDIAEAAGRAALEQLDVGEAAPFSHLSPDERNLRRRLRVHGRQLGDQRDSRTETQSLDRLTEEVAYEHWHRMLFARFLAENNLLMYPDPVDPVPVTLEECEDLATDEGAANGWELAARYASRMLPQIFRNDSPVFQLVLPPEHQQALERLVGELDSEVFTASDSLGWVYQFWQSKRKDEVNASETKIGAQELPAVTQLFTEPYMVAFLLDNSLGAWWAARRLTEDDLRRAETEGDLRRKASLPGVPLEYLRFVKVARPSRSGRVTGLDSDSLQIRAGENLPHWTCDRAIYHVSFRLADSVPEAKRREWLAERQAIEDNARRQQRELTEAEEEKIRYLYSERIEAFLDAGHGACHLHNPAVAEMTANALRHFDGERYHLHAWCIMPNHVHVIMEPIDDCRWRKPERDALATILHSWKSFTAHQANKLLHRAGEFWQEDAYNHIIRSDREYWFQLNYTWENPDKAGLRDWPWRWKVARPSRSGSPWRWKVARPSRSGSPWRWKVARPSRSGSPEEEAPDRDGLATIWQPAAGSFDAWPEDLAEFTLMDPCCGSGHFLVAAFLMLVPMRMELEGLSAREAVDRVLTENLHGLELDKRCVELAAFALALAAWTYPGEDGNPIGYRALPEMDLACSGLAISASKEQWLAVAVRAADLIAHEKQQGLFSDPNTESLWHTQLKAGMASLYDLFREAPTLGSLIDPGTIEGDFYRADYEQTAAVLQETLAQEQSDEQQEAAVVAQGLAKAAQLLAGKYHLVTTNVPYLLRRKHDDVLARFCMRHHREAKGDLATAFLERCLGFCEPGGTASIVLPQNWLFLTSYRAFREKLLKNHTWHLVARLGPGAFETISGEVVKAILLGVSRGLVGDPASTQIRGLDVSGSRTPGEKATKLLMEKINAVDQVKQLENPDSRLALEDASGDELLAKYAAGLNGMHGADSLRFRFSFWEVTDHTLWPFFQCTDSVTRHFGGKHSVFYWPDDGRIHHENPKAYVKGQSVWGQPGVAVSMMGELPVSLYTGEKFDISVAPVVATAHRNLPAIWCFCFSPQYNEAVRRIDQSLKVTNATLVKVPFDLDHWTKVAEEEYPNGLPVPYSDDPTQWIFHGHPCGSVVWDEKGKWTTHGPLRTDDTVLHVAVARLLGYRWPAELDPGMELAAEQREWVRRCDALLQFADEDGLVCIPAVRGEAAATDRLLNLLAAAYGDSWSNDTLAQLLKSADHGGKSLETWLREKFFTQHCKLFQHRPFIWHIWDGLRDGFAALVNYHKLDHKRLETLIYTYLGDWISRCQEVARASRSGLPEGPDRDGLATISDPQEKLAAAEQLKKRLELILEGESPHDIFVRWKPIEEQPIGWTPDLNDGVRLNIRPFMTVPDVGKKGAGVLRDKPNIKWTKDRGKDVESAPWYHLFKGDRINDHHLTLAEKTAAREEQAK